MIVRKTKTCMQNLEHISLLRVTFCRISSLLTYKRCKYRTADLQFISVVSPAYHVLKDTEKQYGVRCSTVQLLKSCVCVGKHRELQYILFRSSTFHVLIISSHNIGVILFATTFSMIGDICFR